MRKVGYQLRKGVNLVHHCEDFYLLSEILLGGVKANEGLYGILCEMRTPLFKNYEIR